MRLSGFERFAPFAAVIMLLVSISPLLSEYEPLELSDGDIPFFSQESYNRLSNNQLLIDESGGTGVSTVVDSYGHAHVSYYNTVSYDLMYSFFDGSGWQTVAVDTSGDTGESSALALNETDIPSIAYYSTTEAALKYATWDGDNWTTTTLDSDGDVGAYASVALDSEGDPHISYLDITRVRLKYASLDDGVWTVMDVGDDGVNGTYSSIVLDNEDNPHIAFHEAVDDDLEYAYHNGTTWNITELETDNSTGHQVSMVIDSNGNSHISYVDVTAEQLKYANNAAEGGIWNITSLAQVGVHTASTHGRTSIGLGLLEEPHITYYNASATSLGYIFHNGTEWESKITDDNGDVGQYSSMAVGPDGGVHVAYHDYTNDDLKYYFSTGIISEIIALGVGTNTDSASPPDIALDSKGNPHITYVDHSNGNLIYMHYNGTWNSEIVTTGASYHQPRGHDPKIVIDEDDVIHISLWYRENPGFDPDMCGIVYAVKGNNATLELESATGWALANVSGQGANMHLNDLVVDDLGRVHFVYAMSNDIWYAQYDYGTGVMSTMEVHEKLGGSLGQVHSISIDLDSSNNPNVVFSVGGVYRPTQTMYAKANVLLSWTVEVIENESYDLGDDITIQVGTDDVPQIVSHARLVDGGSQTYRHAVRNMTTGVWEASNMTTDSGSGSNSMDFKLDSANQPHITFYHHSVLHQASWDDGGWYQSEIITPSTSVQGGNSVGKEPSMVIDESDNAHVVHLRRDGGDSFSAYSVMYGFFGTQMPGRLSVDIDRDGVSNDQDAFPNDSSESNDTDVDGIGDNSDMCPETMSMMAVNPVGCALNQLDSDDDTYNDDIDVFPDDETEWNDTDGDGFGDNSDLLPDDISQWNDTDSDGYGDNWGNSSWNGSRSVDWPGEYIEDATMPDYCPTESGNSTADGIHGCIDSDGNGIADFLETVENNTSSEENMSDNSSEEDGNNSGSSLDGDSTGDDETTEDGDYLRTEYIIAGTIAAIILILLLYAPLRIRKLKKRLKANEYASEKWEELDFDGDGEISDREFAAYKERQSRRR